MFYDIYSLENALMNNEFEQPSMPQLDNYKLIEVIRFLTQKVKDLECQTLNQQTEQMHQQNDNFKLQEDYEECKKILRKMSRDYPELIISHPKFFAKEDDVNN